MKSTKESPKPLLAAVLALLLAAGAAAAQDSIARPATAPAAPAENSAAAADEFYRLTRLAPAALNSGDRDNAQAYAEELLRRAPEFEKNWNYGNALHVANLVLGHLALDAGDLDKAKQYLLAAGRTPGSPQLDSFGPNARLAKALLEKGERETVLEYFDLCAGFWKPELSRVDEWKAAVRENKMPDFRANLKYQM